MAYECGRKKRQCRGCEHRYPKEEYELEKCPVCGEPRFCRNKVRAEGAACWLHGGKSLRGIAHPRFDKGRWSKDMPRGLRERVEAWVDDVDILCLSESIGLVKGRIGQLVRQLDRVGPAVWRPLQEAWETFKIARSDNDVEAMAIALDALGSLIEGGPEQDELVWGKIEKSMEQMRKLVDSEVRRVVQAEETMTAPQVYMLMGAIAAILRQRLKDHPTLLNEIGTDIQSLMSARDPDGPISNW